MARVAANLLAAWLAIRLAADLVPHPALARLVAGAAWVLAALNILHLLEPLAELLDAAALNIGQLRVSVLGVIKGVASLTVLLSARRPCPGSSSSGSRVCPSFRRGRGCCSASC
jgi:hypothetical protein